MKTFVVSLQHRTDRRRWFDDTNHEKIDYEIFNAINGKSFTYNMLVQSGFDTDKNWVDPIHNTHLTSGEVGCFLSHYGLWKKCVELDEPILILEDDAIVTDRFSYERLDELVKEYNFIYLGWLEMGRGWVDMGEPDPIDDELDRPVYPYWTLGYVVTPEAAKILLEERPQKSIIPVDEYLPKMMKSLNACGFRDNIVTPVGRDKFGTDVDPVNRYSFYLDFRTHVVTVGDDDSKCWRLHESTRSNGFKVKNIGAGVEWKGSDMSGPGGGQKVNILRSYLDKLPDHDVVLFMDGFDTFAATDLEEITRRYLEFKCKVLFAAEQYLWPDESLDFPECDTPYRYLNSGLYIGRVDELKKILKGKIEDHEDDQLFFQKKYLSGEYDIALDHECYVFQCHDLAVGVNFNKQLDNQITQCCPCLYHGNGADSAKRKLDELYFRLFGNTKQLTYIPTKNYHAFGNEIIMVDYLTKDMCDDLIDIANLDGGWDSLSYDKFPAQEIRLKNLKLWDAMVKHWEKYLYPVIEHYWQPMEMYGMRDAFVMRYSLDTQTSLALHTDASLVTGSVKLNDNYVGADLVFPRQNFSNRDIPVGKCLLFPGAVTHGHTCTELTEGVKYSLTMWSSRYSGDTV